MHLRLVVPLFYVIQAKGQSCRYRATWHQLSAYHCCGSWRIVSGYGFRIWICRVSIPAPAADLQWLYDTEMEKHYSCLKLVFIKDYKPHKNIRLFGEPIKIYKFLIFIPIYFWMQFWRFRVSGILKACSFISIWLFTFGRSPRAWGSCTQAPGCCTATSPRSQFSSTSTGPGKLPASSTVSVKVFCSYRSINHLWKDVRFFTVPVPVPVPVVAG